MQSKSIAVDFIFGNARVPISLLKSCMYWHKQGFFPLNLSKSCWAGEQRGEEAREAAGRPSGEQEPDHM